MKKITALLLILIMLFSFPFVLSSCEEEVEEIPDEKAVTFEEMLYYMIAIADTEEGKPLINEQTQPHLIELSLGLEGFAD